MFGASRVCSPPAAHKLIWSDTGGMSESRKYGCEETERKGGTSPRPPLPRIILSARMKITQHLSLITSHPPIPGATQRIDRRESDVPTWSQRPNPTFSFVFIGFDRTETTDCGRELFGYSDRLDELTRSALTRGLSWKKSQTRGPSSSHRSTSSRRRPRASKVALACTENSSQEKTPG